MHLMDEAYPAYAADKGSQSEAPRAGAREIITL
jgi:hypothetical protein